MLEFREQDPIHFGAKLMSTVLLSLTISLRHHMTQILLTAPEVVLHRPGAVAAAAQRCVVHVGAVLDVHRASARASSYLLTNSTLG